jgi:electron transfer flavoprotein alpha subunit
MTDRIMVVAEQREGKLNRATHETVAAAQAIGREAGWPVEIVLPGSNLAVPTQELAKLAVNRVYALDAPCLAAYTSDGYVGALKNFFAATSSTLILFPHTYQVRDFAPRLAVALGSTIISDTIGHKWQNGTLLFTRPVFQGRFAADVAFAGPPPWLASVQIGSYGAGPAEAGSAAIETVPVPEEIAPRVIPHEVFQETAQTVDLSQADVIVAVGRGIKEQRYIVLAEQLARALGGEVAASRPICDNGWMPLARQIGSSGQTVAPKLYIALGISGAMQHIAGMRGAHTIVAINHDRNAPIFEIADYGIAGDLFEVVPALTAEIEKAKA